MTDGASSNGKVYRWLQNILRHLAPFLWALIILWLSLTSTPPEVPGVLGWDKLLHAGAYGLLALLVAQLFLLYDQKAYILTSVICILYSGLVEVLQLIGSAGRTAEWWDLFANAVGVVLACVLFRHGLELNNKYACGKGHSDG